MKQNLINTKIKQKKDSQQSLRKIYSRKIETLNRKREKYT